MSACWNASAIRPCCAWKGSAANIPSAEFYAKAEWFNPGGSVKDRAALNMIREGERTGALRPGKTILDATSGNTGIAYAMIGAALGYPVMLCLPSNASPERKRILSAYGAEIILTPADEGSDGAIRRARQVYAADPQKYFYPDQYSNPANWRAHYQTTAPKFGSRPNTRITHFVAGLGTSGTFVGTARRLKELNPANSMHQPAARCRLPRPRGLEAHGFGHRAGDLRCSRGRPRSGRFETEDAYRMVKRLAREEAMLVSPSAAAALVGCMQVAASLDKDRARRDRDDLPRCRREISQRALLGRKRRFLGAAPAASPIVCSS